MLVSTLRQPGSWAAPSWWTGRLPTTRWRLRANRSGCLRRPSHPIGVGPERERFRRLRVDPVRLEHDDGIGAATAIEPAMIRGRQLRRAQLRFLHDDPAAAVRPETFLRGLGASIRTEARD